jgi:hypothetical protein
MSENLYDFAKQTDPINGYFSQDYNLNFQWYPQYIDSFSVAVRDVSLEWNQCKFVSASKKIIPDKHGVYCFSVPLEDPMPQAIHVPLYIGKAAPQYLSERFDNYLKEKKNPKGRSKIVHAFNKYDKKLKFWWATLPRVYVDMIEEHLLMCYHPPCNTQIPNRDRLWGKAF